MKKNFLVILSSILVFSLGLWFVSSSDKELVNYPPKGTKIVAFGDSLVEGVGAAPGNDFVSRMSSELGLPIVNMGRRGDTTSMGYSRIESALAQNPDIVLLLFGGNDAIRGISIRETESNLRSMIREFHDAGTMVILIAVRGGITNDPYSKMYRSLADETGSMLVTDVLRGLFADKRYMADAVHPNDAGHEVIARRIILQLNSVLEEVRKENE